MPYSDGWKTCWRRRRPASDVHIRFAEAAENDLVGLQEFVLTWGDADWTLAEHAPDTTKVRQVAFFRGRRDGDESHTERMIAARFATVEPVFGNLRHNKRLARFTLRGREKVDGQWKWCTTSRNWGATDTRIR